MGPHCLRRLATGWTPCTARRDPHKTSHPRSQGWSWDSSTKFRHTGFSQTSVWRRFSSSQIRRDSIVDFTVLDSPPSRR